MPDVGATSFVNWRLVDHESVQRLAAAGRSRVCELTSGLLFEDIPRDQRPFWINVHASVGLVYFALVAARLA
jgi:hypothetical protein